MRQEVKDYLESILAQGLEYDYWFMTKQTMTDYYFIFTQAKVVETFNSKKKSNENFGAYYSRFFREDAELNELYPAQGISENTYRNAISAESLGLFSRETDNYGSGTVSDAYKAIARYVKNHNDAQKYKYLFDRQIEKLCLNVNPKLGNYSNLNHVRTFPVMFLYKILFELYKATGDSTLYYDELVVFLFRTRRYSDWQSTLNYILWYRNEGLDSEYRTKYNQILNDITATNIRFDTLFGNLSNIEFTDKKHGNYFKIKDSHESLSYIENAVEIFEASRYCNETNSSTLLEFLRSDKYFIGNLDTAARVIEVPEEKESNNMEENELTKQYDNCERLRVGTNIILYGVPGAGKSWTIKNEYCDDNTIMERVVFHPDYTYSDFVGQILPKTKDGDVSYEFVPGPFTKIVKEAYRNPMKKFILVIEEINRGNAPAIFGDIFQLLDRNTETLESDYEITNADIARIVYEDENHMVRIPANMMIVCTMNTSDQNVFTLDTAFQRRWNMRLIENSFSKDSEEEIRFAEHKILDTEISWEQFVEAINKEILDKNKNMTSSEDKRIGTHFVNIGDLEFDETEFDETKETSDRKNAALRNRRFPEKVIKYLWDDAFKFYRDEIFRENLDSLEKVIKFFVTNRGNARFDIFKENIKNAIDKR